MIKKLEIEFLNYREDEDAKFAGHIYRYSIKLSDNYITDIIITDQVKVHNNNDLTEIVDEIIKKIKTIYVKDIIK